MERSKKLKKFKRKKKFEFIVIILMMVFTIVGLNVVNAEIKETEFLENSNLIKFNFQDGIIDFLGGKYYMNFVFLTRIYLKIKDIL